MDYATGRLDDKSDIEKGDVIYMVCMGIVQKATITTTDWTTNRLSNLNFYDLIKTEDGYFYARDYGVGLRGLTLNAVFKDQYKANTYVKSKEYQIEICRWQKEVSSWNGEFND